MPILIHKAFTLTRVAGTRLVALDSLTAKLAFVQQRQCFVRLLLFYQWASGNGVQGDAPKSELGGDRSKTVQALREILDPLTQRGDPFMTVPERLQIQGKELTKKPMVGWGKLPLTALHFFDN